ncbi:MAG TPA: VCBS repeat-containing protein [Saprospiraceae bacterium]|nr:VCBS repeat-containing protein [Saprospiraceae bacterium]
MRKIKKAATGSSRSASSSRKSPSRIWLWIIGLLILIAGAYFLFVRKSATAGVDFSGDSGAEPTLTAKEPVLELLSPGETGVEFENTIKEDEQHNVYNNINFYNGGGVVVADINNDNLPDIYLISCSSKNKLFLNEGNFKFKDITDAAGVESADGFETSGTAVDVNADGWLDLFVCRAGPDEAGREAKLFINNKNLTFTESAKAYGLNDMSPASGANFFDADNDGDLDCYVINHPSDLTNTSKIILKFGPDGKTYVPDLDPKVAYDSDNFYRNESQSNAAGQTETKFVNVSSQAGIHNFGFGLSTGVSDFNRDGWPDIYVCNDFYHPDNLFINDQKGGFTDQMKNYFRHNAMSAMGSDISDFDNDGFVDMFNVDMFPANNYRQKLLKNTNTITRYQSLKLYGYFLPVARNVLQHNNGNGTFSDVACMAGVYATDWSWSCLLADFNNDGLKDLHITNGYRKEVTNRDYSDFFLPEINKAVANDKKELMPYLKKIPAYKVRNYVYENKGDFQFDDKSGDWMTMKGSWSGGAAWADFDADGDLDLVVNNLEDPAFIYKNLSVEKKSGHYLQAKLHGSPANPFAVGASVLIEYKDQKQYQELNPSRGIFSSVEHLIHFGTGDVTSIDRLTVRWPDGKFQVMNNVSVDQRLQLNWSDASGYVAHLVPPTKAGNAWLAEKDAAKNGLPFHHVENPFDDFNYWRLNPWTITDLSPLMAKGDVNGDGLEDFFVGNAFDSPGAVYVQTPQGTFKSVSAAVFQADNKYEDQGALFFDADGDHDLDLYVISGGIESALSEMWQNRLYLNNGKGEFSKAENAVPFFEDMGMRVATHDYDGDGDLDLFIGGRLTAKSWPLTPRSTVLQNNKGKFTDVTKQVAGAFENCGMVTDLQWVDLNKDGKEELIVVGEWMPLIVFELQNNQLQNVSAQYGLEKTNGLWYRLAVADLDKDGDLDLVTGNLGLNTRFTASPEAPFRVYAKDFDGNNSIDPIVTYYENGKIYPLMQKEVLVSQMPSLKKKFLYNKDYAKATVSDIWPQDVLDGALNLIAYDLETCWWENKDGKFIRHALPKTAQISPIQGIVCTDLNSDGNPDLLLAGNKYGFEVETNPCDAGNGVVLLGDGKGNFKTMDNVASGFWAEKEARDLVMLKGAGGKSIFVVSNNNDALQMFTN